MQMLELQIIKNIFQPCWGFFLQGGVKALAMMDIGIQLTMMITFIAGIIDVERSNYWELQGESPNRHAVRYLYWAFYFYYEVLSIVMAAFLFSWANKRSGRKIRLYLVTSVVHYPLWLAFFTSHCVLLGGLPAMVVSPFVGFTVFKLYSFWVVKSFLNEINYYGGFNAALRRFTDAEIEEFENGNPTSYHQECEETGGDLKNRPYKKDFEIEMDRLDLDLNTPLGKGAFGTVLKGHLKNNGTSYNNYGITVAVKTLSSNAKSMYFKALLSELKILSYMGRHENIVNLIGACTSQIRERKIFIVVEFCAFGSVMNYLRANRGIFVNLLQNDEINIVNSSSGWMGSFDNPYLTHIPDAPTTLDLVRWSMQTAFGMEYMTNKKVIHGDLAARNVLLTQDKNIKIADFGLSRQLYQYTNYVKNNDEPMPWRWMSVESLLDMKFSTQSDVWSYGITLWEFYTCGATPYPGYSYSRDFLEQLKQNKLRPEQPQYANSKIYEIMLQCWELEPSKRPKFSDLANSFQKILCDYSPLGNKSVGTNCCPNLLNRSISSGYGSDITPSLSNYTVESI